MKNTIKLTALLLSLAALFLAGCPNDTTNNDNGKGTVPTITTASLPGGTAGTAYSKTLTATGDTPITWSLESGTLPAGLTLSKAGVISGNPTTANTFNFTVKATNATGNSTKPLSIVIASGGSSLPTLQGAITITSTNFFTGTELTANYSGSESVSYQWKNGSANVGTNSNKYTPTTAGSYTVTVSAAGYNPKTSAAVNVTLPTFNNPDDFKEWLDTQSGNTSATAYTVVLNVNSLNGNSSTSGSVGNVLFTNNDKFVNLALSGSTLLTGIENMAFDGCTGLIGITIPDSVTSIGDSAFDRCDNLVSVTFQGTIPSSGFSAATGRDAPFLGDLQDKFYATNSTDGTPGTYKTNAPVSVTSTWTKQP